MSCVSDLLKECGCTAEQLSQATCQTLEKVQAAAGKKICELIDCVGGPRQVGDERYDPAGDIEALLRIMEAAERFCRLKRPKAYAAHARSVGGCPQPACKTPYTSAELRKRWISCCSSTPRVLLGG